MKHTGGHPRFYKILEEMASLHDRKNSDYSKGLSQGPLGNFIRVSEIKKMYPGFDWESPYGTCIDYMLKQFDAMMILRATKRSSQTGEPVGARLRDMQVYSVIAEIIEEEEWNGQKTYKKSSVSHVQDSISTRKSGKRRKLASKRRRMP